MTRTIAVAGEEVVNPQYLKVIAGAKIDSIVDGRLNKTEHIRIINGNVLTGVKASKDDFLGAFANMITVIPEGDDVNEFMGWIAPRFGQFSVSRTFFSWLACKKNFSIDARIKGGERHMIMSNEYDKVFPRRSEEHTSELQSLY